MMQQAAVPREKGRFAPPNLHCYGLHREAASAEVRQLVGTTEERHCAGATHGPNLALLHSALPIQIRSHAPHAHDRRYSRVVRLGQEVVDT
jgi:hypothetical protein